MLPRKLLRRITATPGKKLKLKAHDPAGLLSKELDPLCDGDDPKDAAQAILKENLRQLADAQELLYTDNRYAILVVLQGMDAAGKDGTIKHVMSGVNPLGCRVTNFKQPSAEELDHDFLWRYAKALPERGSIGIFNRSHYEEVLVVRVHPELVEHEKIPPGKRGKSFWQQRYEDINAFEHHLVRSGTVVLKFFLHVSKSEQKRRFLERLNDSEKHWKFNGGDIAERAYWSDYMKAYEAALSATSTQWAPWYVVPADHKWVARAIVADILTGMICGLDLRHPELDTKSKKQLVAARKKLEKE